MMLRIDPASAAPPYEQLMDQIEALVDAGQLQPGVGAAARR